MSRPPRGDHIDAASLTLTSWGRTGPKGRADLVVLRTFGCYWRSPSGGVPRGGRGKPWVEIHVGTRSARASSGAVKSASCTR